MTIHIGILKIESYLDYYLNIGHKPLVIGTTVYIINLSKVYKSPKDFNTGKYWQYIDDGRLSIIPITSNIWKLLY